VDRQRKCGVEMKNAKRIRSVSLACAILACCDTTPNEYAFNKSRTYDQSFDETWDHAIRYLSEHNYVVGEANKEKGIIRATTFSTDTLKSGPEIAECSGRIDVVPRRPSTIVVPLGYDLSYVGLDMRLVANGPTTTVTIDTHPEYHRRARCIDVLATLMMEPNVGGSCVGDGECVSRGVIETQIMDSL